MSNSAVFLERDGVINHNHVYIHKREDFNFFYGIFDVVRFAHYLDYKLVVINSHAGIARSYYIEEQFHELTHCIYQQFADASLQIDKVYFSRYYHSTAGLEKFLTDDFFSTPNLGMILQAQKDLLIDLNRSILIGDNCGDIQTGYKAYVGTNLLFAADHSNQLGALSYEHITTPRKVIPYLQRGAQ
jgi:D-glycero-D-manno-heptose 1,7-bisphosphate phosphatase